jgi:hypothetical protein
MKLKPGDVVTVAGWSGEYVVLDSGETVGRSRCTLVPQEPEWPGDWGKEAEFWDKDGGDIFRKVLRGYRPDHSYPWICDGTFSWKHCRIIRKGE